VNLKYVLHLKASFAALTSLWSLTPHKTGANRKQSIDREVDTEKRKRSFVNIIRNAFDPMPNGVNLRSKAGNQGADWNLSLLTLEQGCRKMLWTNCGCISQQ
jgi:hypothetical protein